MVRQVEQVHPTLYNSVLHGVVSPQPEPTKACDDTSWATTLRRNLGRNGKSTVNESKNKIPKMAAGISGQHNSLHDEVAGTFQLGQNVTYRLKQPSTSVGG